MRRVKQQLRALGIGLGLLIFMTGTVAAQSDQSQSEAHVVSVGGAITEIVYALGAADRLVAVDSTSLYPSAARELPDVGYMRQLSAEPILALAPTLVLAAADAGPETALDQLRTAGVEVIRVPDHVTPDGVVEKVRTVAAALDVGERGADLAKRLERQFQQLEQSLQKVTKSPRVLLLLAVGRGTPMAAGSGTAADGIIALAHGRNAIEGVSGYKPLSREAVVAAQPDVFLTTKRTIAQFGGREQLLARPELAATEAGRAERLVVMDGLLLLGFGPRTPEAAARLAEALHGGLEMPALTGVSDDESRR
ncbi:heme/hemin ABC transporter substrate-binding protein [Rhodovibrio salinarum]|uniref:heme/hemin ABC transporter substrate-binding protein n=1 Tax=Rhodovibrio salinarum TaxID=1087 RepID=UPI0004AE5CA8|nr:hemin ABC transporter substrate-binding protein [Rhodovibrio salinarum]